MAKGEVNHPIFARLYPRLAAVADRQGEGVRRDQLLAGITGTVVEVGAGAGTMFAHYPATATAVTAVEPEPHMRRQATAAAAAAPVPVTVVDGLADALPVRDGSVDAVVFGLVLCSVPDVAAALAEAHRVVRPGGEVRVFEHVRASEPGFARFQHVINPLWSRVAGGCQLDRDPLDALAAAGFTIDRVERFLFPDTRLPVPPKPHVIATGHRT